MLVADLSARYRNKLKPGKVKKKKLEKTSAIRRNDRSKSTTTIQQEGKMKTKKATDRQRSYQKNTFRRHTRKKIKVQTRDRQQTNESMDRQTDPKIP